MRPTSEFHTVCQCGAVLISDKPELTCRDCKRLIRIEWQVNYKAEKKGAEGR